MYTIVVPFKGITDILIQIALNNLNIHLIYQISTSIDKILNLSLNNLGRQTNDTKRVFSQIIEKYLLIHI